jgi:hypothetical protein
MSPMSVVCCQVQASAMVRSFVQRSPTDCSVCDCDPGTSERKPRSTRAVEPRENNRRLWHKRGAVKKRLQTNTEPTKIHSANVCIKLARSLCSMCKNRLCSKPNFSTACVSQVWEL